jgi:hypothetical protein
MTWVDNIEDAIHVIDLEKFRVDIEPWFVEPKNVFPKIEKVEQLQEVENNFRVKFEGISKTIDIDFCVCWKEKVQKFLDNYIEELTVWDIEVNKVIKTEEV